MPTLADVRDAARRIAGAVHETPIVSATRLGQRAGVRLLLKCENLQRTGSFKVRGALNLVRQLDATALELGLITISAGNHGAGLAYAARATGSPCTVVMPGTGSRTKIAACEGYGAHVVKCTNTKDGFEVAHRMAREQGLLFVHPFDDERIIAGAGTVGLEIFSRLADIDVLIVPIGGGGLASGVALVAKTLYPKIRVYGVEPEGASAMRKSLDAGHPVRLDTVTSIADGLTAPMAGEITYEYVKRFVDDVVVLRDDEIVGAMGETLASTKLLAEPAGAAGVAALFSGKLPLVPGERVVVVLSGGNVDLERVKELL